MDMPWNSTTARLSENSHSAYIRVTQWHVPVFTGSADPLIFTPLFPMSSFPTVKTSALWSGTLYLVFMVDLAFKFSAHWVSWKGFSAREWDNVKNMLSFRTLVIWYVIGCRTFLYCNVRFMLFYVVYVFIKFA